MIFSHAVCVAICATSTCIACGRTSQCQSVSVSAVLVLGWQYIIYAVTVQGPCRQCHSDSVSAVTLTMSDLFQCHIDSDRAVTVSQ